MEFYFPWLEMEIYKFPLEISCGCFKVNFYLIVLFVRCAFPLHYIPCYVIARNCSHMQLCGFVNRPIRHTATIVVACFCFVLLSQQSEIQRVLADLDAHR